MTGDPERNLRALSVHANMSVTEMIEELANTSFGGRRIAAAYLLARSWRQSAALRVIATISGAMSIANQTSILAQLVSHRLVHAIVATGAVVTHSIVQECGGVRRAVRPGETDDQLAAAELNRVHDTLESDGNLNIVARVVDDIVPGLRGPVGSHQIVRALGGSRLLGSPELVAVASQVGVPLFVPALSDCELGLRLADRQAKTEEWSYDAFADLRAYRSWLEEGSEYAVLSLGGGVPRNWAQQMFAEVDRNVGPSLVSGLRICPDVAELGHLSGSTFSEATSWRKIRAYKPDRFVEVLADATLVFPLIAEGMLSS